VLPHGNFIAVTALSVSPTFMSKQRTGPVVPTTIAPAIGPRKMELSTAPNNKQHYQWAPTINLFREAREAPRYTIPSFPFAVLRFA